MIPATPGVTRSRRTEGAERSGRLELAARAGRPHEERARHRLALVMRAGRRSAARRVIALQAQAGRRETASRIAARPREVAREDEARAQDAGAVGRREHRETRQSGEVRDHGRAASPLRLDLRHLEVEMVVHLRAPAGAVPRVNSINPRGRRASFPPVVGAALVRVAPRMPMELEPIERRVKVGAVMTIEPDAERLPAEERRPRLHEEEHQGEDPEDRAMHRGVSLGVASRTAGAVEALPTPTLPASLSTTTARRSTEEGVDPSGPLPSHPMASHGIPSRPSSRSPRDAAAGCLATASTARLPRPATIPDRQGVNGALPNPARM